MKDLVDFWLFALLLSSTYFGFTIGKIVELNKQTIKEKKVGETIDRIFALEIKPSGETKILDMTGRELEVIQESVEGWIEGIALGDNAMIWCNEEGNMLKLLRNSFAEMIWDAYIDRKNPIVGTVVLTGGVDERGDLFSLTKNQIDRIVNDIKFLQVVQPLKGKNANYFKIYREQ
jgi:actin-related protein